MAKSGYFTFDIVFNSATNPVSANDPEYRIAMAFGYSCSNTVNGEQGQISKEQISFSQSSPSAIQFRLFDQNPNAIGTKPSDQVTIKSVVIVFKKYAPGTTVGQSPFSSDSPWTTKTAEKETAVTFNPSASTPPSTPGSFIIPDTLDYSIGCNVNNVNGYVLCYIPTDSTTPIYNFSVQAAGHYEFSLLINLEVSKVDFPSSKPTNLYFKTDPEMDVAAE